MSKKNRKALEIATRFKEGRCTMRDLSMIKKFLVWHNLEDLNVDESGLLIPSRLVVRDVKKRLSKKRKKSRYISIHCSTGNLYHYGKCNHKPSMHDPLFSAN